MIRNMAQYTAPIQNLINALSRLPGIGLRSAERIAFHLLKLPPEEALKLAEAIRDAKTRIRHCSVCYNLSESDPCEICSDPQRDQTVVCVVEQPKDLLALESAGSYRGVYHVLLGRIAPLDGVEPGDLTISGLMDRLGRSTIREVIMGTNPTVEGDTTALYLQNEISKRFPDVQITRLARGIASGSSIEFANRNMLAEAIAGRQKV
ncbi:MAG: recombination protein RecR [Phycisphaerae bacterium]|nr:MAG: recombination protein RecR [Phycisphaerae bacterium]